MKFKFIILLVSTFSINCYSVNSIIDSVVGKLLNCTVTISASSTTVCEGGTVALVGGGASTYTWEPGTVLSASIVVNPGFTSDYTLTGTTMSGCVSSSVITIFILPNPTVTTIQTPPTLCVDMPGTLSASGAQTYTWTGNNTTVVSPTVIVTSTLPTISIYTVTGKGSNGCVSDLVIPIFFTPAPPLTLNATFSTICMGETTALSVSGANTYTWSNGSNTTLLNVAPVVTSVYSVTGQNGVGCKATRTIEITVKPTPVIVLSSATVCASETTTLTASGAISYTWSNGATTTVTSVTPSASTVYSVTGKGSNGCTATQTVGVYLDQCLGMLKANARDNKLVMVKPNPSQHSFIFKFSNEEQKQIEIVDLLGKTIQSFNSFDKEIEINVSDLPEGIYYACITAKAQSTVLKLVKN